MKSIGNYAFSNCTSLASVTFAENSQLTSIGNGAFYNCTSLASIEIPASVTSIGKRAFAGDYDTSMKLASVTFDDIENSQLTSIGDDAFYYCTSLASIEIPASVTSIGELAFSSCTSLASVTFENTNGWWYSSSSDATSGTSISATDLADPAKAAYYLRSTYDDYYWKRS